MSCTLDIHIEKHKLKAFIQNNQKITVMKSDPQDNYPIIWLSLTPLEHIQLSWIEIYNLYAYLWNPKIGSIIVQNSFKKANVSNFYLYKDGLFKCLESIKNDETKSYIIQNNQLDSVNFGLSQAVQINQKPHLSVPINLVPGLPYQEVIFYQYNKLRIFVSNFKTSEYMNKQLLDYQNKRVSNRIARYTSIHTLGKSIELDFDHSIDQN